MAEFTKEPIETEDTGPRISARAKRIIEDVDSMPSEWRGIVHDYGYSIAHACRANGVKSPQAARRLIQEIWDGARSSRDRGGAYGTLDWLLSQSGSSMSALTFIEFLRGHNLIIVPRQPTKQMIEASMAEVSNHGLICSKREKHHLRLRAALHAEENYMNRLARRGT